MADRKKTAGLTPLKRVIIFVRDVRTCAQFYIDVFGFTIVPGGELDDPDEWIELETGGCRLAMHKAHGGKGPTGGKMNPHKIVFYAEDAEAARAGVIERGAKMGKVHKYGSLVFSDGKDPEGHVFQISNR